jgi:two-component system LytT family response regulator
LTKISTIIVDDEIDACEGLQLLLSGQEDIEVVSICRNGREAISSIRKHQPHLVLLDIQMPGFNGFEVLEQLDQQTLPAVIFVTAYDEYALDAFRVHALDYLQKPFTDERFFQALDYARRRLNADNEKLRTLLEKPASSKAPAGKLKIKASGKIHFIDHQQLLRIEGFDYYIKVHTADKMYLVRESLKGILSRLPEPFVRTHKSTVINLEHLASLEPLSRGNYEATLSDGSKVLMSKSYRDQLSELL